MFGRNYLSIPNFSDATAEVWAWIINLIMHFARYVITYPCWNSSQTMLVKGATDNILEHGNLIHKFWPRPLICTIVNTNYINHYNPTIWDSEYLNQWLTTTLLHVINKAVSSACKYLIVDIVVMRQGGNKGSEWVSMQALMYKIVPTWLRDKI